MLEKLKHMIALPKSNIAPIFENRPGPKRKQLYSNHPFSGASCLFTEVYFKLSKFASKTNWTSQLRLFEGARLLKGKERVGSTKKHGPSKGQTGG